MTITTIQGASTQVKVLFCHPGDADGKSTSAAFTWRQHSEGLDMSKRNSTSTTGDNAESGTRTPVDSFALL